MRSKFESVQGELDLFIKLTRSCYMAVLDSINYWEQYRKEKKEKKMNKQWLNEALTN
jgi:hypothetical protein